MTYNIMNVCIYYVCIVYKVYYRERTAPKTKSRILFVKVFEYKNLILSEKKIKFKSPESFKCGTSSNFLYPGLSKIILDYTLNSNN